MTKQSEILSFFLIEMLANFGHFSLVHSSHNSLYGWMAISPDIHRIHQSIFDRDHFDTIHLKEFIVCSRFFLVSEVTHQKQN